MGVWSISAYWSILRRKEGKGDGSPARGLVISMRKNQCEGKRSVVWKLRRNDGKIPRAGKGGEGGAFRKDDYSFSERRERCASLKRSGPRSKAKKHQRRKTVMGLIDRRRVE